MIWLKPCYRKLRFLDFSMLYLTMKKGYLFGLLGLLLSLQPVFGQENSPKQLWYGCMNGMYPFEMILEAEEGPFFSGSVLYQDLNISYEIAAQVKEGKMIVHELNEQSDIMGRFELEVDNGSAVGKWQSSDAGFALNASISLDPSHRCRPLKAERYQLSSELDRNGVLWLTGLADGSRKGRFWNEQTGTLHDFLIFKTDDQTFAFCDTSRWEGYKPEEDPLALEQEIISAINCSKGNEVVLIDYPVYDFGRAFTDSCLVLLNRNLDELLPTSTDPEPGFERWQNRFYLNTEIDLWNIHYISGSVEIIGQKGVVDAFCFIYDRKESMFRDVSHFLKTKYIDQQFDRGVDFETIGISIDKEGLIVKGAFSPMAARKIKKQDWRALKKYFKGKLLDKLLETR